MNRKTLAAAISMLCSAGWIGLACAGPLPTGPGPSEIVVSDGINTVSCKDGDPCDGSTLTGVINFSAPLDGWVVNVDVGTTKPIQGSATEPQIDLTFSLTYNSAAAQPGDNLITIEFSDPDFLASPASFTSSIGGTFAGGVTQVTYQDYAGGGATPNALFDQSNPLCGKSFNSSPFSDNCSKNFSGLTPYSLTELVTAFNPNQANGQASGDHLLRGAPEPATLLLMGAGLLGLGYFSRRRNRNS